MESFTPETLTILVLVAIVLTGVTFITFVIFVIIYFLCPRNRRRSDAVSPTYTRSVESSVSSGSRSASISSSSSSSVSPIPIKSPAVKSTKREVRSTRQSPSDTISIIEQQPRHDPKHRQQLYRYDQTPTRTESRRQYPQPPPQQKPSNLIYDSRLVERQTPYPADVLARERIMLNHLRIPKEH